MPPLSIIIPVFNEAAGIVAQLQPLQTLRDKQVEIILVDGGSTDNTLELARPFVDIALCSSEKGRARQMNIGAEKAQGRLLLFLHGDTFLPADVLSRLSSVQQNQWGFFCLRLSGQGLWLRLIERMINIRSRLSSVATGDQCLFIDRSLFLSLKGYAAIPLMEDVEISKRLRGQSSPVVISAPVTSSSRRWEERGVWPTILLMWRLRFLYFIGVPPHKLVKKYY